MKHKFLISSALLLIVIGIVGMIIYKFQFQDEYSELKQTWTLQAHELKKLNIDSNYDVDIAFSSDSNDEGYIKFEGNIHPQVAERLSNLKLEGPEFSINLTPPSTLQFMSVNFKIPKGKISIVLPEGTELDDLNISTFSADILLKEAIAKNINVTTLSGNIDTLNLTADQIHLDTKSGDIEGEQLTAHIQAVSLSGDIDLRQVEGAAKVETFSGDLTISQIGVSTITANTLSGNIDITADPNFDGFYEAHSLSGSIKIPDSPKESKETIIADTKSGDIDISLP